MERERVLPNWKNRLLKSASHTPKPVAHGGCCVTMRPARMCSLKVALTLVVGLPIVNCGPMAVRPLPSLSSTRATGR